MEVTQAAKVATQAARVATRNPSENVQVREMMIGGEILTQMLDAKAPQTRKTYVQKSVLGQENADSKQIVAAAASASGSGHASCAGARMTTMAIPVCVVSVHCQKPSA